MTAVKIQQNNRQCKSLNSMEGTPEMEHFLTAVAS